MLDTRIQKVEFVAQDYSSAQYSTARIVLTYKGIAWLLDGPLRGNGHPFVDDAKRACACTSDRVFTLVGCRHSKGG